MADLKKSGYCDNCDEIVAMESIELKKTNKDLEYYHGYCPDCKNPVYDIPVDLKEETAK
jgi:hypothetical protein